MSFCQACGHQNDAEVRYCPRCGTPTVGPAYAPSVAPEPVIMQPQPPVSAPAAAGRRKNWFARLPLWVRLAAVFVLLFGVGPIVWLVRGFQEGFDGAVNGKLSAAIVEREVTQGLSDQAGTSVSVRCPNGDEPLQAGRISDCIATSAGEGSYVVRITQDDSKGHFRWELTPQRAAG